MTMHINYKTTSDQSVASILLYGTYLSFGCILSTPLVKLTGRKDLEATQTQKDNEVQKQA